MNYHMLVWVANGSDKLIAFHRKLNFHLIISSQSKIEHLLPACLSKDINDTRSMDHLFEVNDRITLLTREIIQNFLLGAIKCKVCGHTSALNIFCNYTLPGSSFQVPQYQRIKKTKEL